MAAFGKRLRLACVEIRRSALRPGRVESDPVAFDLWEQDSKRRTEA